MQILGIDIGGSGIKGAPVDTQTGMLLAERFRIPTPRLAKPRAVAKVVAEITAHFDWHGPVGCGFPAVVRNGVTLSAANVDKKWIGLQADALLREATGCPVWVINDADAAGLAEMAFGAGRGRRGLVLLITVGTGIGSAVFIDGKLVPNTEFGHIEMGGVDAEWRVSDATRQRERLSWKAWASRFNQYLKTMEKLLSPDLIILGGGIVKKHAKILPLLSTQAEIVPAQFLNQAGIVGAALAAQNNLPLAS